MVTVRVEPLTSFWRLRMSSTLCSSSRFPRLRRFLRAERHPLLLAQYLYIPAGLITGRWEAYLLLFAAELVHQIAHERDLENEHPDGTPLGSNIWLLGPVTVIIAMGLFGLLVTHAGVLDFSLRATLAVTMIGGSAFYSRSLHARRHEQPTFTSWWWTAAGVITTLFGAIAFRLWT